MVNRLNGAQAWVQAVLKSGFVTPKSAHSGPTIRFVDTRIRIWHMDF
jgi:hypothetical protein